MSRSRPSDPRGGALVLSLDFELFWGVREKKTLEDYRNNLEGTPGAVRRTLDLFEKYGIHATWACVGLLFARTAAGALRHAPDLRPTYHRQNLSPYAALERGAGDAAPSCHFAPDLIAEIRTRPHQEIGTHTFSHYFCDEVGQTAEQFNADLGAAIAIAGDVGIRLRSLVFPRNQSNPAYLPILARHGITSYRGVRRGWAFNLGPGSRITTTARRAVRLADNYVRLFADGATLVDHDRRGPINIPGSRFLRPYSPRLRHLDPLRIRRLEDEMTRAAKAGHIYHLWWHPHNFGVHTSENIDVLTRLIHHAKSLDEHFGFPSRNMNEVARHMQDAS